MTFEELQRDRPGYFTLIMRMMNDPRFAVLLDRGNKAEIGEFVLCLLDMAKFNLEKELEATANE